MLPRFVIALFCLAALGCGGDESQKEGTHISLLGEAVDLLEAAVEVSASSDAFKREMDSSAQGLDDLSSRARDLGGLPKDQRGDFEAKLNRDWVPALGKLHAVSLAVTAEADSATAESLGALNKSVAAVDDLLVRFLHTD